MKYLLTLVLWTVGALTGGLPARAATGELMVYGPGGPLGPMRECGDAFAKLRGVTVTVTAGPEAKWIDKASEDADLIFGGAEYMLTQFIQKHPGMVDESTRASLYSRASGILVRKGNPKNIRSLRDLVKPGIRIVDVNGAGQVGLWEDMAGREGLIGGIRRNIAISVTNSAEAIERWKADPTLDAWINYESWHYRLKDETDLVRVPDKQRLFRGTPIAVTAKTDDPVLAREFITYLKGPSAHAIFRKWGWQ